MSIIKNIIDFFRRPLISVDELDNILNVISDSADENGDGYVSFWEIIGILWKLWGQKH